MALRAGTAQATTATINNTSDTPLNVAQSLGFTPYKTLAINRVSPNPAIIPQAIPRNVARKPSFNTIWKMSPLTAPRVPPEPPDNGKLHNEIATILGIDPTAGYVESLTVPSRQIGKTHTDGAASFPDLSPRRLSGTEWPGIGECPGENSGLLGLNRMCELRP